MYKKIGIIREGKQPIDRRVPLPPLLCREVLDKYPDLDLVVQHSPTRAYMDAEYELEEVPLVDGLDDRELIVGVKEVPIEMLLPGKSYLFFSHTIKKQPHNRKMLRTIMDRGITLIDHELLTDGKGERVLAFGRWAGVVGSYNAFRAWQLHHGSPDLEPANECYDRSEMERHLAMIPLRKDLRIVITGGGRVGKGAMEVLDHRGVKRVDPGPFLTEDFGTPAYCVVGSEHMYTRADGKPFDKSSFHADPSGHDSTFVQYAHRAHIYLACHFWDPRGPKLLTADELRDPRISLRVIADISCDVGGPIDSTLRSTTIAQPMMGYDKRTATECPVGSPGSITVMAVDNLPCELPRDASEAFGRDLIDHVLPNFLGEDPTGMIDRATIVRKGALTERFLHLVEYAQGDV
ncbi:MAG: alanine dehydrogenase [Flavobacteriales bacterium]|nr:alanine dehydrogenase [Flavobacteriales bacterium]